MEIDQREDYVSDFHALYIFIQCLTFFKMKVMILTYFKTSTRRTAN